MKFAFKTTDSYVLFLFLLINMFGIMECVAQQRHGKAGRFASYEGLVMAGYQGWFRTPQDGSGRSFEHYGPNGKFEQGNATVDLWPDTKEYTKTYETSFKNADGSAARVFSSYDKSTTELHFKWMKEYGVDGVFMQRFYGVTKDKSPDNPSDVILRNALEAAQKNDRAIAVMYDLSGLPAVNGNCSSIIEDWKRLVDNLKVTSFGAKQNYLFHNGKPVVAIWGLGFPDRPYNIREIGINRLIDFLKNDPIYGGCAVMLGVPTYFRELDKDCLPDPYLHELIRNADIVQPWMVQRFTPLVHNFSDHFRDHVVRDLEWTKQNNVDYVPTVYPGFSWQNLATANNGLAKYTAYDAIPRLKGRFYWDMIYNAIKGGSKMLYVAMFDEIDEATAIFKIANDPPQTTQTKFVGNEGMPSDHYLFLTGKAAQMLRNEIPLTAEMPTR
jgi:hypothetical protein